MQKCAIMLSMNTYTVSQFAKMTGYSVKTLQRWDRKKILVPSRSPTKRRLYTDDDLEFVQGGSQQGMKTDDPSAQDQT